MSEPRPVRAVFFDRDGTLMQDVGYCGDPAKVRVSAGVPEALARLKRAGFKLLIITNQSGIGRGLITRAEYEAVQARLLELLGPGTIDATYVCPDLPDAGSSRRKPAPGMLLEAAAEHGIDLSASFMVGDHPKDVLCAQQAGVTSIFVGARAEPTACSAAFDARDLVEAVDWILAQAATTFRPDELPSVVRAFNAVHRLLSRVGFGARGFDPSELMAAARKQTGLSDFGDPEFRQPLERLCQAFEASSELSAFGRASLRGYCVRALGRRLEIEHCLSAHPEIERERIERPLFIVGLPRTGSTHLHHLLAADPAVRAPLFWQLLWPVPPPDVRQRDTDPRIARARRAIRRGQRAIPELGVLHSHEAEGPEECHFLLDAALMNPLLPAGDAYERWWRDQSMVPAYRYYRKQLQLLQWRWPGDHWVLKAPFHLWHLGDLLDVFPDARFVFTHRDPAQVVPSAASYAAVRSRTYFERLDPHLVGQSVMNSLADMIDTGIASRALIGEARIIDVTYDQIVSAPLALAERASRELGYVSSPESRARMQRYLAEHPQHKHGVHRYGAEQFSLSSARIRERFASYLAFCEARFGAASPLSGDRSR